MRVLDFESPLDGARPRAVPLMLPGGGGSLTRGCLKWPEVMFDPVQVLSSHVCPTAELCLGPYGGPRDGGLFHMSEVQGFLEIKDTHRP